MKTYPEKRPRGKSLFLKSSLSFIRFQMLMLSDAWQLILSLQPALKTHLDYSQLSLKFDLGTFSKMFELLIPIAAAWQHPGLGRLTRATLPFTSHPHLSLKTSCFRGMCFHSGMIYFDFDSFSMACRTRNKPDLKDDLEKKRRKIWKFPCMILRLVV